MGENLKVAITGQNRCHYAISMLVDGLKSPTFTCLLLLLPKQSHGMIVNQSMAFPNMNTAVPTGFLKTSMVDLHKIIINYGHDDKEEQSIDDLSKQKIDFFLDQNKYCLGCELARDCTLACLIKGIKIRRRPKLFKI